MRDRIGKFELLRPLGQGSMGEVYLARDPGLGRQVAIKTILQASGFGAESGLRFEREARALAALNHPHIVTLYDFGIDGDLRYLVMEFLEGDDLAGLIEGRETGRDILLEALAQACEALDYAHGRGMVHRDVKPGNIRVLRRGRQVQAKLMDFGIASVERSELTLQGSWMGTVNYMAPEYLDSGKATPACDLFACGVVLYEILSGGRKPFTGDTPTAVLGAILHQKPAPLGPAEILGVPAALLDVLDRALAKDPCARFANAGEMAEAIRAGAAARPATPAGSAPEPPGLAAPGPAAPGPAAADSARPLVVGRGPRATCLSLRVALRQAQPGATIQVLPGTYREAVLVDKDVTIQGEGDPEGVHFPEGFTVAPGAALGLARIRLGCSAGPGLRLLDGARLEVEDACFDDAPAGGVEVGPEAAASFRRCRFHGNGSTGLLALEGARAALADCELSGNRDSGLHACAGATVTLRACRLLANQGFGVSGEAGAGVVLEECRVTDNAAGDLHLPGN